MHTLHLGPIQQLVSLTLHFCISSGIFAPRTVHLDAVDMREMSPLTIKSELFVFYKMLRESDEDWRRKGSEALLTFCGIAKGFLGAQRVSHMLGLGLFNYIRQLRGVGTKRLQRDTSLLQVWNLTMGMLGNEEKLNLNAKAAESRGLLRFMNWLLQRHEQELKFDNNSSRKTTMLLQSSKCVLEMDDIFNKNRRVLSRPECQQLLNSYARFLLFYRRAGGILKPKSHLLYHMIQRALQKGNPRMYSTYRDEGLNGIFAKIARSAHRRTWSNVIHWKASRFHQKNFEAYVNT